MNKSNSAGNSLWAAEQREQRARGGRRGRKQDKFPKKKWSKTDDGSNERTVRQDLENLEPKSTDAGNPTGKNSWGGSPRDVRPRAEDRGEAPDGNVQ